MEQWIDDSVQKQYKEGLNYHRNMGYINEWPENVRFYDGDQWPPATERTKNLPRPVFNIIKYIVNHKVASVLNENIKMVFVSQEVAEEGQDTDIDFAMQGADKFSKNSSTTWENIQQDLLNEEMLHDGSQLGTGILHYYWDNELKGGIANQWVGDIAGECIDPINCFFGNPQEKRVQKQPYILISSRDLVSNVRELAKANNVPLEYVELIKADKETENEGYDAAKKELDGSEKVTVVTKYFKKNGTVHFKKVVNSTVVQKDTDTGLRIYPIVVMQYDPKKKSAHGNSDVKELIPNQKGINFLLAMMLLSAQGTAWPKLLAKPGAIKQNITNTPGEVITDHSGLATDGIKYMQTGSFNPQTIALVDKFIDITRTFAGAQDVATGEAPGANMAASAIMMLQKSAGVPIEGIKKRYYRAMEDVGRIWEEFWKVKYNLPRAIKVKDEDGNETMDSFTGTEYEGINFNLKIDIGPAGVYSEGLAQSTLDKLFDKGAIDLQMYLKYSPKSAMPFKDSLLRDIERMQQENQNDIVSKIFNLLPPDIAEMVMSQLEAEQQGMPQQNMSMNEAPM